MIFSKIFKNILGVAILLMTFNQFANAQWDNNTGQTKLFTNDKVGIGTVTSPAQFLQVEHNINAWLTKIKNGNCEILMGHKGGWGMSVNTKSNDAAKHALVLRSSLENTIFRAYNDGRVSIGIANPTAMQTAGVNPAPYRLFVNGGAIFKEVKVEANWADYVFEEDYELTPLTAVEAHIEAKGHLHNTPSATELEQNGGVELGAITVNQQEKIEELFLHLIELNKKYEQLQEECAELKRKRK